MNWQRLSPLVALASGLIFGLGLLVSGMNNPAKVRAFLDVFGAWEPALIAVMGSAVTVFALAFWLGRKRSAPVCASVFHEPTLTRIDARLLSGAILFGVGWGLVGLCPGPALVNIFTLNSDVLLFVVALLLGNRLAHWLVGPVKHKA
ncbi:YeeE/YedE family protein [Venatoribacter cucullus]|uniref:YeeE/YedE family protein n=1 Tax=Venatoribacter cucullus TaxID=2661630 RepID=UPI002240DDDC|nr:YeeE/YedE family protein [Venatoribacter cucullus]UZK04484.1 YeeE/YedE family protein [Venatoribacter cucullus]